MVLINTAITGPSSLILAVPVSRNLICSTLTTDALRYKRLGYAACGPIGDEPRVCFAKVLRFCTMAAR